MPQPFIFKTASFFLKVVSFEESGGAGAGGEGDVFQSEKNAGSCS